MIASDAGSKLPGKVKLMRLEPADKRIIFDMTQKEPSVILRVQNTSEKMIAFKVLTTHPKSYLVRPISDVIPVNGSAEVKISLQLHVAKDLRQEGMIKFEDPDVKRIVEVFQDRDDRPSVEQGKLHKFMVQSTVVSSDMEPTFSQMLRDGKTKEINSSLKEIWQAPGTPSDRFISEKLQCLIEFPQDVNLLRTVDTDGEPLSADIATLQSSVPAANIDDIVEIRKKYNEIINFTVQLTSERDRYKALLKEATKELQLLKKGQQQRMSNVRGLDEQSSSDVTSASQESTFSLWHVLVAALLAFLMGRLLV